MSDFWDDLGVAIGEGGTEYFLGPVILAGTASARMTVIDGQQRLATASVLVSVIRDRLESTGDSETASDLQRNFLGDADLRTREITPKLVLNDEDRDFFRKSFTDRASDRPQPRLTSHRRLSEAREFFEGKLAEYQSQDPTTFRERALDWVDAIQKRAIVMLAVVPENADANAVFESLNARGLDLAVADLLKNYLFARSGRAQEEVGRNWELAINRITEVDDEALTDFFRHYWNSHYRLARKENLYREFRGEIRTDRQARKYAEDLAKASDYYAALLNPTHDRWRRFGDKLLGPVGILFSLRLKQNRPMLLAAIDLLSEHEMKRLVPSLLSWSIRGIVVGGYGEGLSEKTYAEAALAIRGKRGATSVEDIMDCLSPIVPSDVRFQEAFKSYMPPTIKLAHYLLRALEWATREESEPWLVPNPDKDTLTLEHILPRNPRTQEWPGFPSEDEVKVYAKRLGNLTLIPRALNTRLGNKQFDQKVPIYRDAPIRITSKIADFESWSPQQIQKRQDWLAELALRAWPRIPVPRSDRVSTRLPH